jgi:hypothetical protein
MPASSYERPSLLTGEALQANPGESCEKSLSNFNAGKSADLEPVEFDIILFPVPF